MIKESLLTLVRQAADLELRVIESAGEITPEIEAELMAIDVKIPAKIDSYHHVMSRLDTLANEYEDKIEFLEGIANGLSKVKERIKERLVYIMRAQEIDELKGETVRIALTSNQKLKIDESKISDKYKVVKPVTSIDNKTIKDLLLSGLPVEGAELEKTYSIKVYAKKDK